MAAERAESVVVVHQGVMVESGAAQSILQDPQHEYTRRLVAAAPSLTAKTSSRKRTPATDSDDIVVASQLTKLPRVARGAMAARGVSRR